MAKKLYYRGIEDPISGTFDLAEEVSSRSIKIVSRSLFALYFAWFSLIVASLVTFLFLVQGNWFLFFIFLSLVITGIMTVRLLNSLRDFLKKVSFRYVAIRAMREGPPTVEIPSGKNRTERFINYLKENNGYFRRLIRKRPEILHKDAYVVGRKGRRYHFDAYIQMKPSFIKRIFGGGGKGYSMYIREYRRIPTEKDLDRLLKDLRDIYQANKVYPGRVVMLFKAKRSYDGLPDALYERMIDKSIRMPGKKDHRVNLQAAAELSNGKYEFVPFIPELDNMLP